MAMAKSSKMLTYINYRMRVTIADSRTLARPAASCGGAPSVEPLAYKQSFNPRAKKEEMAFL